VTVSDIWTNASISELSDDNISDFEKIVISDLKGYSSNHANKKDLLQKILNSNLDLWLYTLQTLRRSVEYQLSSSKVRIKATIREMKKANASQDEIDEVLQKEETWRINSTKFLLSIEKKTLYVKLLLNEED
jgi:hypothetical protein